MKDFMMAVLPFVCMANHPKSLVRNRVLHILAVNTQWDDEDRFDAILTEFLSHITDEKPITSRQCIQALSLVGKAKPQYIPKILLALREADLCGIENPHRLSSPYRRIDCGDFCVLGCVDAMPLFRFVYTDTDFKTAGHIHAFL